MVVFKGNKRIFDKVIQEDNSSTGAARKITVYGVTSYSDIENVPIQINSTATGAAQATINVNNLGAKSLKVVDGNGITVDVSSNWSYSNQVYTVVYKAGNFLLVTQNQSGSSSNIYAITNFSDFIGLTSSSTAANIATAFNNDESAFINGVLEGNLVMALGANFSVYINYGLTKLVTTTLNPPTTTEELKKITLEFIYGGYYYKHVYDVDMTNVELTSVTVTKVSVESPTVTVESDLTSDSQVNPPSVHAVNVALGQIDTILTQILGS